MRKRFEQQNELDAQLTIMKGLGHFCQLGSPAQWVTYVSAFYTELKRAPNVRS